MAEQQDGEDSNNLTRQNNSGGPHCIPSECHTREKGKKGGGEEGKKEGKKKGEISIFTLL